MIYKDIISLERPD